MVRYKQKCPVCKKNFVEVSPRQRFAVCYDCQKRDLEGEVKDPEMKKLLDIPLEYYMRNPFLRSIKINYLKFGNLTEKQIEAFKKSVEKMKENKE